MSNKLSVGIQYAPKCPTGGNYFEKITYRLGGFYNNTYLIYNNIPIKDYVISFGAGLPITNSGTMFNFAVEIGSHGEKSGKLVEINYTRISLGLTFCDFRFNKRN
jgi:hypothetical protein